MDGSIMPSDKELYGCGCFLILVGLALGLAIGLLVEHLPSVSIVWGQ